MTKINAQYFRDHMSEKWIELENKLDKWLKDDVLPEFCNRKGYHVPEWITPTDLKDILETRGFEANTYSDHTGNYVYIMVPAGDE